MISRSNHSIATRRRRLGLLWALSGFSTLTLEMAWMREMALWSGNTVTAATLITSVFFACAAAGNLFGARLMRKRKAPLRTYGLFEMAAALSALLSLFASQGIWPHLGALPRGILLHAGIALLIAGPASFFSGIAFPCLAEAYVPAPARRSISGAPFYALNLLGATVGVVAGGVLLPWHLGIRGTFIAAAVTQLLAGAQAWRIAAGHIAPQRTPGAPESTFQRAQGWIFLTMSGVLALATQALMLMWVRQVMEGSIYAMSAALAVFVGGLGLGAFAAAFLRAGGGRTRVLLRNFSIGAAVGLFILPFVLSSISVSTSVLSGSPPYGIMLKAVVWCARYLLPVSICLGGVFPLAWELVGAHANGEGHTLGRALTLNKLGAAAGGVLCLFFLLPLVGLIRGTLVIGMGYTLIALTAHRPNWLLLAPLTGLGLLLMSLPAEIFTRSSDSHVIEETWGPYGSVKMVGTSYSPQIVLNNRQYLSGTHRALSSQLHQSWVPLLMCREPQRVCTIGMAAGISADAALDFPIRHLDAVELVPEVVGAARRNFEPWNRRLFDDPRASIIIDDGRQVLARTTERYDAIVCDLFFPAEEGTAHLYSREFLELARSRLSPGGLFCVWLPAYQHSAETAELVVRTFLEVFPKALMVRSSLDPMQPVAGLIGSLQPLSVSAEALEQRIDVAGLRGRSPFLRSGHHAQMLLLGDLRAAQPGFGSTPLNTDDRPRFAWLGPAVAPGQGLYGVRFLNWAGRRFPEARFDSCELPREAADDLLLAIRAANHYLATAVAATVLPEDPRPAEVREEQVTRALERARALSPQRSLNLDDLSH